MDGKNKIMEIMAGARGEWARAHVRAWSAYKSRVRVQMEDAGLDSDSAERVATNLADLLEWMDWVRKDLRKLGSSNQDITGPVTRFVQNFAHMEAQMPRFRGAVTRTRRAFHISPPITTATRRVRSRRAPAGSS